MCVVGSATAGIVSRADSGFLSCLGSREYLN